MAPLRMRPTKSRKAAKNDRGWMKRCMTSSFATPDSLRGLLVRRSLGIARHNVSMPYEGSRYECGRGGVCDGLESLPGLGRLLRLGPLSGVKAGGNRKAKPRSARREVDRRSLNLVVDVRHTSKYARLNSVCERRWELAPVRFWHASERGGMLVGEDSCGPRERSERRHAWGKAPRRGFEPLTLRLTAACSTIELPGNDVAARAGQQG
jgi:hypothetical protein